MIRGHALHLAVMVACTAVLAACGSGQQGQSAATSTSAAAPGTAAPASGQHYQASISLVGQPEISADGKDVVVTVHVTNTGSGTFGSTTEPNNVNLGALNVDSTGKVLSYGLPRGHLPQVGPGATVVATTKLPIEQLVGNTVEILPVQEGVAWFDKWGTKPLVVGPFKACSDPSKGKLCDAQGNPLATAAVSP